MINLCFLFHVSLMLYNILSRTWLGDTICWFLQLLNSVTKTQRAELRYPASQQHRVRETLSVHSVGTSKTLNCLGLGLGPHHPSSPPPATNTGLHSHCQPLPNMQIMDWPLLVSQATAGGTFKLFNKCFKQGNASWNPGHGSFSPRLHHW